MNQESQRQYGAVKTEVPQAAFIHDVMNLNNCMTAPSLTYLVLMTSSYAWSSTLSAGDLFNFQDYRVEMFNHCCKRIKATV